MLNMYNYRAAYQTTFVFTLLSFSIINASLIMNSALKQHLEIVHSIKTKIRPKCAIDLYNN